MPQAYAQCSLYLHPRQHNFAFDKKSPFIAQLQKIGFIAQVINKKNTREYFTGNNFLNYIAYMGCAPNIQFEANQASENFCHIKIHHHKTAQLIYNKRPLSAPICPNCKKPVKDWQENETTSTINCKQCNTTSNIENFNWRKMAGHAQTFIEITDIFPKEAIPQQALLDELAAITRTEWQYFYSCQ